MDLLILTFKDLNFDFNIILYFLLINDYTILKVLMTYIVSKMFYPNSNIFKLNQASCCPFFILFKYEHRIFEFNLNTYFHYPIFLSVNPLTHPSIVI